MFRGRGSRRHGLAISQSISHSPARSGAVQRRHTCDDLGALEVLVRVQVARRQREVDAHQNQEEVDSPPHGACRLDAPLEGKARQHMRMSVVVVVG